MLTAPTPAAIEAAPTLRQALDSHRQWFATGGASGQVARLEGRDLRPLGTLLANSELTALKARGACLAGMVLAGAMLQGADLDEADLRGADLRGADLRGASLRGANLSQADLREADLRNLGLETGRDLTTKLDGAMLRYADLREAKRSGNWPQADTTGARGL